MYLLFVNVKKQLALLLAIALLIAVPTTKAQADGELGGILGAVIGGLTGNQFGKGNGKIAATIAGVIAGAVVGYELDRHLSDEDKRERRRAHYFSYETHEPVHWRGRHAHGFVNTTHHGWVDQTTYCRQTMTVTQYNGRTEKRYARHCRSNGSWSTHYDFDYRVEPRWHLRPVVVVVERETVVHKPKRKAHRSQNHRRKHKISPDMIQNLKDYLMEANWDRRRLSIISKRVSQWSQQRRKLTVHQVAILAKTFDWDDDRENAVIMLSPLVFARGNSMANLEKLIFSFDDEEDALKSIRILAPKVRFDRPAMKKLLARYTYRSERKEARKVLVSSTYGRKRR